MNNLNRFWTSSLLALFVAVACGKEGGSNGSDENDGPGGAVGDGDTNSGGSGDGDASTGGAPSGGAGGTENSLGGGGGVAGSGNVGTGGSGEASLEELCTESCSKRVNEGVGLCIGPGYFGLDSCNAYCSSQASGWDQEISEAFEYCAETDPLCFQTIHQCMFPAVFGPEYATIPSPNQTIRVDGDGFGSLNGRSVVLRASKDFAFLRSEQTTVVGDSFSFAMATNETYPAGVAYQIRLYIDVDDSGSCDHEQDDTFSGFATPIFGTSPLEYHLSLHPSDELNVGAEETCAEFPD